MESAGSLNTARNVGSNGLRRIICVALCLCVFSYSLNAQNASIPRPQLPRNPQLHCQSLFAKGVELEKQGDLAGATARYSECREQAKGLKAANIEANAAHRLAVLKARNKKFSESANLFREAIALDPQNSEILCDFAQLHIDRRMYEDAETILKNALLRDPNNTKVLYRLGITIATQRNREAEGSRYLKLALGEAEAYKELARLYRTKGDVGQAEFAEQRAKLVEQNQPQSVAEQPVGQANRSPSVQKTTPPAIVQHAKQELIRKEAEEIAESQNFQQNTPQAASSTRSEQSELVDYWAITPIPKPVGTSTPQTNTIDTIHPTTQQTPLGTQNEQSAGSYQYSDNVLPSNPFDNAVVIPKKNEQAASLLSAPTNSKSVVRLIEPLQSASPVGAKPQTQETKAETNTEIEPAIFLRPQRQSQPVQESRLVKVLSKEKPGRKSESGEKSFSNGFENPKIPATIRMLPSSSRQTIYAERSGYHAVSRSPSVNFGLIDSTSNTTMVATIPKYTPLGVSKTPQKTAGELKAANAKQLDNSGRTTDSKVSQLLDQPTRFIAINTPLPSNAAAMVAQNESPASKHIPPPHADIEALQARKILQNALNESAREEQLASIAADNKGNNINRNSTQPDSLTPIAVASKNEH